MLHNIQFKSWILFCFHVTHLDELKNAYIFHIQNTCFTSECEDTKLSLSPASVLQMVNSLFWP